MADFQETKTYSVNCPACQSEKVIKAGQQSGEQRYQCRDCDKWFRASGKPEGRRVPAEQMGMAVRMFYSGMSYKQIAESMSDAFDIPESSKSTIYEWVRDYTDRAVKTMQSPQFKAQVGDSWVADEMQVVVGGEKYWNWNVMDEDTRYILATHLSKQRNLAAATAVMRKASLAAAKPPKTIKTDRLASYPGAIDKVFPETRHIQSDGIRAEVNNNLSERLQGTFRQRTKTLRGLDSRETGQRYLDGWALTYNLFREHESLDDRTPGEAAKVKSPYGEWADVVRQGSGVVETVPVPEAKPPKARTPRIVPVSEIREVGLPDPPRRELERLEKVRTTGPRSPARRSEGRLFQSAAGKGKPPQRAAWAEERGSPGPALKLPIHYNRTEPGRTLS